METETQTLFTANTVQATAAFITLLFLVIGSIVSFAMHHKSHGDDIMQLKKDVDDVKKTLDAQERRHETGEAKTQEILVAIQTSMASVVSTVSAVRDEQQYTRRALDELRSKVGNGSAKSN